MATLEEVMAVLYSAGEPMPGSCMSDDEALAYARQHLVYGGYCLVRNSRWLDLKVCPLGLHAPNGYRLMVRRIGSLLTVPIL